jgi:4-hydroxy-tetrahydrodipicolinate reductase
MGRMLMSAVLGSGDLTLAAALEHASASSERRDAGGGLEMAAGVTVSADLDAALQAADVLIDFTRPEAIEGHVAAALRHNVKLVIGTTGLSSAQVDTIRSAAHSVPIVFAPCMSASVAYVIELLQHAATLFDDGYDIEIIETHHRHKTDAPSGTALAMGEAITRAQNRSLDSCAVYGRTGDTGARPPAAIGFAAVRGGDIVGEHTVLFAGTGERVEITHRATSRMAYVDGALRAARFLQERESGLFDMRDVLGLREPH